MKRLISFLFVVVNCTITLYSQKRAPQPIGISGDWTIQQDFSDEFDRNINKNKWSTNIDNWPAWSSDSRKVLIKNKRLQMSIDWDKHKRNGKQLYFKSGILTSKKKIKYGYFEVKMKGAPRFPGASPAFWLYSRVRNSGQNVKYVEIDCPELQSKQRDNDIISWNVVHINKSNVRIPIRQETGNGVGPSFDPSKKFHVYGCHWTKDKIEFYIDGKKIGRTVQNKFHKYAMNLIVSLGLREPYYFYDRNGVRQPVPTPDRPSKFPMISEVEYVRVWKKATKKDLNREYLDSKTFDLYVNQNEHLLSLNIEEINNKSEASIIISDIQGKVIHKESFSNSNFELNTSNIKSGIYIITIENGQNLYTRKVIFE